MAVLEPSTGPWIRYNVERSRLSWPLWNGLLAQRVWETWLYCTGCVGGHRAREPIALGLAEEIVDGGAEKWAAFLLLTHQLRRQIDETV